MRIGQMISKCIELLPWKRFEKRAQDFAAAHRGAWVTDEQLLADVFGSPTDIEANVAIAIRRLIARDCGVAPEKIGHGEATKDLAPIMGAGGFLGWALGGPYGLYLSDFLLNLTLELETLYRRPVNIEWRSGTALEEFGKPESRLPSFGQWLRCATTDIILMAKLRSAA